MIQVVECQFKVIFCLLTNRKCEFFQVDKATIQVHIKVTFCIMSSQKNDFRDVEKAMFHVVANQWELIFFPLTSPKSDSSKVEKAMFQGAHVTLNSYSASWLTQNATWVRLKKRCLKVSHGTLISGLWNSPK